MPGAQIGKGIGTKTVILLLKNVISFINIVVDKGEGGEKRSLFLVVYQCSFAGAHVCWIFIVTAERQPFTPTLLKIPSFKRRNTHFLSRILGQEKLLFYFFPQTSNVQGDKRSVQLPQKKQRALLFPNQPVVLISDRLKRQNQCKCAKFPSLQFQGCSMPRTLFPAKVYDIFKVIFPMFQRAELNFQTDRLKDPPLSKVFLLLKAFPEFCHSSFQSTLYSLVIT